MRTFLLLFIFSISLPLFSQIVTENFNTLALGGVATDPTGNSPGTTGYYIYGGTAADYQIVNVDAAHGNSLKITSGNSFATPNAANSRFAFKYINPPAPTATDEVIQGSIDIYTGTTASAGKGQFTIDLYDATGSGIAGVGFDYGTRKLVGKGRITDITVTPNETGYYFFYLGTQTYPDNTWVSLKFYYIISTGKFYWITPHGSFTFTNVNYAFTPNLSFKEYDFFNTTLTGNTITNDGVFDNLVIKYNTLANADVEDIRNVDSISTVRIYPNPTTNYIKMDTQETIQSVKMYDLTGKQIPINSSDNGVDVSQLNSGVYILKVTTDVGESSHKIIKR